MKILIGAIVLGLAASVPPASPAQASASPALVEQLVTMMTDRQITSLAAALPGEPERFVAGLLIPGSQLMVISARYAAPTLLQPRLDAGEFRQVYVELHSAGDRAGRVFIEDLAVNGLHRERDGDAPFDITWRDGVTRTLYDGKWKEQGLTRAEYQRRFDEDEKAYVEILNALIAAARTLSTDDSARVRTGYPERR